MAAIAAGMVHSLALADDGALFYWMSADPDLRCQQVLFEKAWCVCWFVFNSPQCLTSFLILFCSYIHCAEKTW